MFTFVASVLRAAVTKRGGCSEERAVTLELLFTVERRAQEDTMKWGGTGEKVLRRVAAASSAVGLDPCTLRVCFIPCCGLLQDFQSVRWLLVGPSLTGSVLVWRCLAE